MIAYRSFSDSSLYAIVLEWAARMGMVLLCLAYGVYVCGGKYLAQTPEQIAAGWSLPPAGQHVLLWPTDALPWLDWFPLASLMVIASISLLCMFVLVFVYAQRRCGIFFLLATLQSAVIIFAMSGAANRLLD